jgi:hypothetical protein
VGFAPAEVTVERIRLPTVEGRKTGNPDPQYLLQGAISRLFRQVISLTDYVEVMEPPRIAISAIHDNRKIEQKDVAPLRSLLVEIRCHLVGGISPLNQRRERRSQIDHTGTNGP